MEPGPCGWGDLLRHGRPAESGVQRPVPGGGGAADPPTPDRAISLAELFQGPGAEKETQILVGDGAELCYNYAVPLGADLILAPPHLRYQRASGVARAAALRARQGELIPAADLAANYLRLSQAERERQERLKREESNQS